MPHLWLTRGVILLGRLHRFKQVSSGLEAADDRMTRKLVECIADETGRFRVIIFQREDGSFGFEDQTFSDEPTEQCWISRRRHSESFCDSARRAVKEAHQRVDGLKNH